MPPRGRISDLVIGQESASDEDRQRVLGEDAPHGVVARMPSEPDTTDRRDLMVVEGGMLGLEYEDGPLDFLGQGAMALHFRRTEQAGHPLAREARRLTVERALRRASQTGALCRGMPEEDDGADQLVRPLLGERTSKSSCCQSSVASMRCCCPIVVRPPVGDTNGGTTRASSLSQHYVE